MYWETVKGAFSFHELYQDMVNKCKNDAIFVEIGIWHGKSIIYLAEKIIESKKKIKLYGIDIFKGTDHEYFNDVLIENNVLYNAYLKNIEPVKNYIITIIGDSHEVYKQFKDHSIDFCFIDADHSYKAVKEDLVCWFPKIKKNGIIAGHDYTPRCAVKKAVDDFFPNKVQELPGANWVFERHIGGKFEGKKIYDN